MTDPVHLEGNQAFQLPFTTSAVQSPQLAKGEYAVWSDVNCYIRVSRDTANGVTSTNGYKLFANNVEVIEIDTGRRIGVVGDSSGTLNYHKVT